MVWDDRFLPKTLTRLESSPGHVFLAVPVAEKGAVLGFDVGSYFSDEKMPCWPCT